jgi:hypothetical protein
VEAAATVRLADPGRDKAQGSRQFGDMLTACRRARDSCGGQSPETAAWRAASSPSGGVVSVMGNGRWVNPVRRCPGYPAEGECFEGQ